MLALVDSEVTILCKFGWTLVTLKGFLSTVYTKMHRQGILGGECPVAYWTLEFFHSWMWTEVIFEVVRSKVFLVTLVTLEQWLTWVGDWVPLQLEHSGECFATFITHIALILFVFILVTKGIPLLTGVFCLYFVLICVWLGVNFRWRMQSGVFIQTAVLSYFTISVVPMLSCQLWICVHAVFLMLCFYHLQHSFSVTCSTVECCFSVTCNTVKQTILFFCGSVTGALTA